jgi:outer membrane protein TolC
LIDRAVRANPDIEIALTRLQEVRTQEAVLVGDALPLVAASADAGRGTGSDLTRAGAAPALRAGDNKGNLNQIRQVAGFAATWELDLFGGYRRAIEAGRYDVQAAAAARNAVLISVIADVARNYVDMRGLQVRLSILNENIATAQQSRDLEQTRYDRGITNELDLQLAIREFSTLRVGIAATAV